MINRKLFAETAEKTWKTVKYKEVDCQQFVENCAKAAGYKFNALGTNDIWRHWLAAKGNTASFPLAIGDVVLKWRQESDKLPARYKGDGEGDVYHIGVLTSLEPYTVCHSANSRQNGKKDTFLSLDELSSVWQLAGTLKNTEAAQAPAQKEDAAAVLEDVIAQLENLKDTMIEKL